MFDLSGKTAIVTGGGKGIGAAICKVLANAGASVALLDIDPESAQQVESQIKSTGGKLQFFNCNVAEAEQVTATFRDIATQFGRIDLLVNNAGVSHIGDVLSTSQSDLDRLYQINVKSVFLCVQSAIPYLIEAGGGAIINMSSIAAEVGLAQRFAYSMSKGAVQSMTYSIAKDFLAQGIRCNAIGPGRVHTPFVDDYLKKHYPGEEKMMFEKLAKSQPIGRMGEPEEIAALVLYLCSDEARFVTGSFYPIDGGFLRLNT
ncbi:MAG: SDR family oxidoreductase [Saprospiraceae bacterium]